MGHQVLNVELRVGDAPCDVAVVTGDQPWQSRHVDAGGLPGVAGSSALQMHRVQQRRHAEGQVGVVAQQRTAVCAAAGRQHPAVRACGAALAHHRQQRQQVGRGIAGRHGDGQLAVPAGRLQRQVVLAARARRQRGGLRRRHLLEQLVHHRLVLGAHPELQAHQLQHGQRVGHAPGLQRLLQQLELDRQAQGLGAHAACRCVDAFAEGVEHPCGFRPRRRLGPQRVVLDPQGTVEAVALQRGRAEHFGQAPQGLTAQEVHLPEAVERHREALPEPDCRSIFGRHVGQARGTALDAHRVAPEVQHQRRTLAAPEHQPGGAPQAQHDHRAQAPCDAQQGGLHGADPSCSRAEAGAAMRTPTKNRLTLNSATAAML